MTHRIGWLIAFLLRSVSCPGCRPTVSRRNRVTHPRPIITEEWWPERPCHAIGVSPESKYVVHLLFYFISFHFFFKFLLDMTDFLFLVPFNTLPGWSVITAGTRHRPGGHQNGHRAADFALARIAYVLLYVDLFEFERERGRSGADASPHPSLFPGNDQHQRDSCRRVRLGRLVQSTGGTPAITLVQSRRPPGHPERSYQRAPGTRFDGDGATPFLPAPARFGSHRQRNSETRPSLGHVLQTGSLLGPAHRPIASFGR